MIAAINGPAVGVGITMTLPMDVRLAAEERKIGFVFARRGIVPEACSRWFLPRIVGISQAMEWCAAGRVFTAEEALAAGSCAACIRRGRCLPSPARSREIAEQHRAGVGRAHPPAPVDEPGAEHPMAAHRADSRAMFSRGQSDDAREGVTSFLEEAPGAVLRPSERRVAGDLPRPEEPAFS